MPRTDSVNRFRYRFWTLLRAVLLCTGVVAARPATAAVIHEYRLDEHPISAGTVAVDSVGTLDGTYSGGITSTDGFGSAPNRAAHFDGSTSYLQLSDQFGFNVNVGRLANSTVTAWIKVDPDYATGDRFIYDEADASDGCCGFRPTFLLRLSSGVLQFGIHRAFAWNIATVTSMPALDVTRWYLVAGVLSSTNGEAVYLFDDTATLLASGTNGNTLPTDTFTNYATIGAWTGNHQPFLGALEDVTFHDDALTAAEIAALPLPDETCITPPTGMVGWWPGDGDAGDIVGGHDGT